jgi:hypothetical protein
MAPGDHAPSYRSAARLAVSARRTPMAATTIPNPSRRYDMRYLRLALLPLVFAACTEQLPTAETPEPQFDSQAVPATQEIIPLHWEYNLCGYDDIVGTGTLHHSLRVVLADESGGMNHFFHVDHYKLTYVGQNTGDVWKYNDTTMRMSQWYETAEEYGPDTWMRFNEHVRVIGFGDAPSFEANNVVHTTVNANGELVMVHEKMDPVCETF